MNPRRNTVTVLHLSAVRPNLPSRAYPPSPTPTGHLPQFSGEAFLLFLSVFATTGPLGHSFLIMVACLLPLASSQLLHFLPIKNEEVQLVSVLKLGKTVSAFKGFHSLHEDVLCTHAELPWHVHRVHSSFHATGLCISAPKTTYYLIILYRVQCHQISEVLRHGLSRFRQIWPNLFTERCRSRTQVLRPVLH